MTKNIDWFVEKMTSRDVEESLEELLDMGADPSVCMSRMKQGGVRRKKMVLLGAGVDPLELYQKSGRRAIVNPLDSIKGKNLSQEELTELLKNLDRKLVAAIAAKLYDAGASLALIHKYGGARAIGVHIPEFLKRGEPAEKLARLSDVESLRRYCGLLKANGADGKFLFHEIFMRSKLTLAPWLARGLGCDEEGTASKLLYSMDGDAVFYFFDDLIGFGYEARDLAKKLDPSQLEDRFEQLIELGVDPKWLAGRLDSSQLTDRLMRLLELGVDPKWIARQLEPVDLLACSIPLEMCGVKVNRKKVINQIRAQDPESWIDPPLPSTPSYGDEDPYGQYEPCVDSFGPYEDSSDLLEADVPQGWCRPYYDPLNPYGDDPFDPHEDED